MIIVDLPKKRRRRFNTQLKEKSINRHFGSVQSAEQTYTRIHLKMSGGAWDASRHGIFPTQM